VQACGARSEALQKISAAADRLPVLWRSRRCAVWSPLPAFRLKGSGWYETDFKTGNKKNLAGDDKRGGGADDKAPASGAKSCGRQRWRFVQAAARQPPARTAAATDAPLRAAGSPWLTAGAAPPQRQDQDMRTHYCGELRSANIDETVTLCGWVDRRRDHGGVIFLDLRDREGIVQVVFDPDTEEHFATADRVRSEYVLQGHGARARAQRGHDQPGHGHGRDRGARQDHRGAQQRRDAALPARRAHAVGEEVRLRYRYMDLRRPEMQQRLRLRSRVTDAVRASSTARVSSTSRRRS
jgi:predicted nucleic acid-binding Zn ribbon protein